MKDPKKRFETICINLERNYCDKNEKERKREELEKRKQIEISLLLHPFILLYFF